MIEVGDRACTQYFKEVSQAWMPHNATEERDLFQRYYADGDLKARDKIIEGGLRFVIKMAKQYSRGDIDFLQTLVAAGNVGLLVAIDRYRPWVIVCPRCNKSNYVAKIKKCWCTDCRRQLHHSLAQQYTTRFLTYAAWWISEAIRSELYDSSLVHIPPYKQKEHHRERQGGKDVGYTYLSLDESDKYLTYDGTDEVIHARAQMQVRKLLSQLKERHAYVLIAYYGLREEPKTLNEIAKMLGVCSERVRQIKLEAMNELHRLLTRHRINSANAIF